MKTASHKFSSSSQIENPGLCLTPLLHQGFITMAQFRGIIAEVEFIFILNHPFHETHAQSYSQSHPCHSLNVKVDPNLSEEDLDGIIAEIDEDGSGTMDFDEFCEMMMTSPEDQEGS